MATEGVALAQTAVLVRFLVELSEKVPVAVKLTPEPTEADGLAGVTAIDTSVGVAAVQVRVVEPFTAPMVALMSEVPAPTQLTICVVPKVPRVALAGVPEVHVELAVTSRVLPSEYRPLAINPRFPPTTTVGLAGVTVMLESVGVGVTQVKVVLPVTEPTWALIREVPAAMQFTF